MPTTLIGDELHEASLEIINRTQREVVTVIEVLSPSNIRVGSRARTSYEQRHNEVIHSPSYFVEIDLLRDGVSLHTREALPYADYYLHVSRHQRRPKGLVWPIQIPQRVPTIDVAVLQSQWPTGRP